MPDDRNAAYGRTMRVLHWSTAALLLGPYLTVWAIGHIASEADAVWLAMLHRSFGIQLLLLTVTRLLVRGRSAIPPLPSGIPALQRLAARLNVAGLYALLIAQPLLGIAGTMVHGDRATVFGNFVLPAMLPVNPKLGMDLFAMHGWVAVALLGLIGMHAIAALHHHFVRRDTVLLRMLPGARHVIAVSAKRYPIRGDLS
jgi:cytochrome b561